ncbi:MAG: M6 family metalloprotease domain-containing protein [Muribaculaceae bacterium]|nr:M6 family metalloprotease domain-containing protein [Muribaculaceae bacterium]
MKKIIVLLAFMATLLSLRAVPAHPRPIAVPQPSGDSLTIPLVGDEFYHYYTTADGYTVLHSGNGWEYARIDGERLASTGVTAHDPGRRTAAEQALVATLSRHLTDRSQVATGHQARMTRDQKNQRPNREPVVDYSKFRGLIVLINFTDKKFGMSEPNAFYDDMVNTQGYTGFYTGSNWWNQRFHDCPGSMRDYFSDQSMGQFDPLFDVVGPVEVPYSCREGGSNYSAIFQAALDSIDNDVDFTQYDSDGDGGIDMVFFLVAGYAASYGGNSQEYLWPHMSYLYGYNSENHYYYYLVYDGMYMGRYASSTEIYGWEAYGMTDPAGIGTMCHEFSHVLGLPDLYDTDYEQGGGQSFNPGNWDVMAGGSYGNEVRTPVGYSLWERHELGWAEPLTLDSEGNYQLNDLTESNNGFIMNTPINGEYFYFENRQNKKWDSQLPGHGMVVARVDYTNREAWNNNRVNANPRHNYYELVRSGGTEENTAFPGPTRVTTLNYLTEPSLATWNGTPCPFGLTNIQETNGVIYFKATTDNEMNNVVEDFETMPLTVNAKANDVRGRFARWNFINTLVAQDEHFGSQHECDMNSMPAAITMNSEVSGDIHQVSVTAHNSSTTVSKLQLYYSTDQGASWMGEGAQEVPAGETVTLIWRTTMQEPVRFRITRTAGSKTASLFIDNFTISCFGELTYEQEDYPRGDVNGDGNVDVDDVNLIINIILEHDSADNYGNRAYITGGNTVSIEDLNALINLLLN